MQKRETVITDDTYVVATPTFSVQRIIYYIADVIVALIGLRFVFLLFGANPANDFIALLYGITQPLVTPFSGIFGNASPGNVGVFEWASIMAIIIYGLIAYALAHLVSAVDNKTV